MPPFAVVMRLSEPQAARKVTWGATVDTVAGEDVSLLDDIFDLTACACLRGSWDSTYW